MQRRWSRVICKPTGPSNAKIVIVGEAPGAEEDRVGRPFVGGAGKILNTMLSEAGIDRNDCYITNVMDIRPVNNNFGEFYEDAGGKVPTKLLIEGRERLYKELVDVHPNVVIALGNEALKAILGLSGITKYRGSILPNRLFHESTFKVIPTIHPDAIMRQWELRPLAVMDLRRALEESRTASIDIVYRIWKKVETLSELESKVDLYLREAKYISFDIETCNKQISCIGFAENEFNSFTVPICMYDKSFWSEQDELKVWLQIKRLLESDIPKIGQNVNFDMFYTTSTIGIKPKNLWMDTMIAFHCVTGDTEIDTLKGAFPIKDLVGKDDVWIWSCIPDGTFVPAKASNIRITQKNVDVVRISYWYHGVPGEGLIKGHVDVTPDHRIRLLNGKWVKAEDLLPGDSLTRLRLTHSQDGRQKISLPNHKQVQVSQYIASCFKIQGEVIHHIDGDVTNNNPENITGITKLQHNYIHDFSNKKGGVAWNKGKSKLDNYDVKGMYESGMSTIDIANITQMNQGTVVNYMKARGIESRTLSQAQRLRRSSEVNAKVISVKLLENKVDVYNMEVDKYHCFSANHIIVHNCLYPELPKSLATLCSIYSREPYYKDLIGTEYYRYNCLDCMITYECAMAIDNELKEFGMHDFYHKYINNVIPILLDMQLRGVKVDTKKRALAAEQIKGVMNAQQKKLNDAVGHEMNVNSTKQMSDFLYRELGLPIQTHRKTGKISTNEAALKNLAKFAPNSLFDVVIDIRESRKLISTYLESEVDPDGRFRCSYLLDGTESGRLASRMSSTGTGGNLQNVPKGIAREVFIPDKGKMFMAADLSQAEARVVAYISREQGLINIFESGKDIHKQVAASIFNKKVEDVTKEERELAKRIVHASNYGMGARHFGELIGISQRDAQEKLNAYHAHFPNINIWHMEVSRELRRSRTLSTPMGRKRMFFGRWNDALLRDGYSYIPQSTVADVVLKGMINIQNALPKGGNIVFNIHDEIVIQIPIEWDLASSVYKMKELMIRCMSIPVEIHNKTLIIPVNVKTGMNWNEVS